MRKGLERGVFVKVRIIPSTTFGDVMNTLTPNNQVQA